MVRLAYGNLPGKVIDQEDDHIVVEWEGGMTTREAREDLEFICE